jgi:hypothetical protein
MEAEREMWEAVVANDTLREMTRAECDYAAQKALDERSEPFSDHQGSVGEKIERNAVLTKSRWIESMYGSTLMHTFVDDGGNIYIWFSNGRSGYGLDEGTHYLIHGTVKKHDTFRGVRQTVLTRCKVVLGYDPAWETR